MHVNPPRHPWERHPLERESAQLAAKKQVGRGKGSCGYHQRDHVVIIHTSFHRPLISSATCQHLSRLFYPQRHSMPEPHPPRHRPGSPRRRSPSPRGRDYPPRFRDSRRPPSPPGRYYSPKRDDYHRDRDSHYSRRSPDGRRDSRYERDRYDDRRRFSDRDRGPNPDSRYRGESLGILLCLGVLRYYRTFTNI
jgi:hypothetical protein